MSSGKPFHQCAVMCQNDGCDSVARFTVWHSETNFLPFMYRQGTFPPAHTQKVKKFVWLCEAEARCRTYKAMVRPLLCSLVFAYCEGCLLKTVQRRAEWWACGCRCEHVLGLLPMMCVVLCVRLDYLSACALQNIRHIPFSNYCTDNTAYM